jgi:hypothetical protein
MIDTLINLLIYLVAFVIGNVSGYYQKFNVWDWVTGTAYPFVEKRTEPYRTQVTTWIKDKVWPYVTEKKTIMAEKIAYYEHQTTTGEEKKED